LEGNEDLVSIDLIVKMKTSRMAQQTSSVMSALARNLSASGRVRSSSNTTVETESKKRKRGSDSTIVTKVDTPSNPPSTPNPERPSEIARTGRARKGRRQPAKKTVDTDGAVKIEPPPNWEEMYRLTQEMRAKVIAPVDEMGCEQLALKTIPPRDQRFQTLISLMLSSQTKDQVTAAAIKNLQDNLPGVSLCGLFTGHFINK
jgi:endonuclease III